MTWTEMYEQLTPAETFQLWLGIFSAVILVSTAAIMVWQVRVGVESFRKDHDRRRLESTLNHIKEIRSRYRELLQNIYVEIGVNPKVVTPLTEQQSRQIEENPKLLEDVKDVLGLLEHLSVGMHLELFDIHMLNRMAGYYFCSIATRFNPYIERVRRTTGNEHFYHEFTSLVETLMENRKTAKQAVPLVTTSPCQGDEVKTEASVGASH